MASLPTIDPNKPRIHTLPRSASQLVKQDSYTMQQRTYRPFFKRLSIEQSCGALEDPWRAKDGCPLA
jgi:hypothetical protein